MVNLITQNINGNPINSSLVKQNIEEPVKSAENSIQAQKLKISKYKHKLLLPLGLIGGGDCLFIMDLKA